MSELQQWLLTEGFQVKDHAGQVVFTTAARGVLTFVDLYPSANWAHPCVYLYEEPTTEYQRTFWWHWPPGEELYDLEMLP